jgi:DNA-binding transcriptional regulator GbsR (MarR family)
MGVEKYPEALEFILHWGEMGTHWGANRSVAQVHALLYLSDQPLDAEAICEALDLARSNVSTALKELQGYGIARLFYRGNRALGPVHGDHRRTQKAGD